MLCHCYRFAPWSSNLDVWLLPFSGSDVLWCEEPGTSRTLEKKGPATESSFWFHILFNFPVSAKEVTFMSSRLLSIYTDMAVGKMWRFCLLLYTTCLWLRLARSSPLGRHLWGSGGLVWRSGRLSTDWGHLFGATGETRDKLKKLCFTFFFF